MSVIVNINQKTENVQKIGLEFLANWTVAHNLYYGVPNAAYVLDSYSGEEDIREQLFILFDRKRYGRGMSFYLDENYNLEVVLNLPATRTDIQVFYTFIDEFCKNFDIDTFTQEDEEYTLEQIEELTERLLLFNQTIIKENLKADLTIFGCVFPIVLEDVFIKKIAGMTDEEACNYFEIYLNQKQHKECYYAKPMLYGTLDGEGGLCAKYALTDGVPSIFPIETYLPFGYNQDLKSEIKSWSVLLVAEQDGELKPCKELEYSEFCSLVDLNTCQRFDAKHVILMFDKGMLAKIEGNRQEQKISKGLFESVKSLFLKNRI